VKFAKAHGLGNDFILVGQDAAPADAAPWARRLCDRHEGIGGDGVLVYRVEAAAAAGPVVHMRLLNADGSDGEVSGNGVRCLAAYVCGRGWLPRAHVVRTPVGPRPVEVFPLSETRARVVTDLGAPRLASDEIPVAAPVRLERVVDLPLEVAGRSLQVTSTSLGNPHCAVFVERPPDDALLAEVGAPLERHALFPRRTNVEFVCPVSEHELRVRFWERGVGYTRASGTGAASAAVAAILKGVAASPVRVACDGGTLDVEWTGSGPVRQTGEVELLFEGEWLGP
jgi:diaminopimelate epimerase